MDHNATQETSPSASNTMSSLVQNEPGQYNACKEEERGGLYSHPLFFPHKRN